MLKLDRATQEIHRRVNLLVDVMENAEMSEEGHNSAMAPFCMKGPCTPFRQDFKRLPELPEGLNRNFKYLYEIIGNPTVDVTLQTEERQGEFMEEWTIMALDTALKIYQGYVKDGQTRVFDFAYRYLGMGHVEVVSCDLHTHNLFLHRDGGSNGYDRMLNHQKTVKFQGTPDEFFFLQWFSKFVTK